MSVDIMARLLILVALFACLLGMVIALVRSTILELEQELEGKRIGLKLSVYALHIIVWAVMALLSMQVLEHLSKLLA
jgi:hypothetical protein